MGERVKLTEARRCPACGYTAADKRRHMDHHLCPLERKNRAKRRQALKDHPHD